MITKLISRAPEGMRAMDAALYLDRSFPLLGKARINGLIRARQLRIGGIRAGENAAVKGGDETILYLDGGYDRTLRFLYDRDGVIAFIKPAGLPTDVDEDGIGADTVLTRLKSVYPGARLVHRLDTGTDGVMLAAADDRAEEKLTYLFRNHLLIKLYRCSVLGHMPLRQKRMTGFLIKDARESKVRITDKPAPGALPIETLYTVEKEETVSGQVISRLLVEIPTGRTHQIRAHMSSIGHPLLGDDKYGDREINKRLKAGRIVLSCREIRIKPEADFLPGQIFTADEEKL